MRATRVHTTDPRVQLVAASWIGVSFFVKVVRPSHSQWQSLEYKCRNLAAEARKL